MFDPKGAMFVSLVIVSGGRRSAGPRSEGNETGRGSPLTPTGTGAGKSTL